MADLFKKALSWFVILNEEKPAAEPAPAAQAASPAPKPTPAPVPQAATTKPSAQEIERFEAHFAKLFDGANLPGPDYYEFWKMMDALEAHIPAEDARVKAVYESLKIQGLSKENLYGSVGKYREVIEQDKAAFEAAARKKADAEILGRQQQIKQLLADRDEKAKMLAKLQQEIEQATQQATALQSEIAAEQQKIESTQRGYQAACAAMLAKIDHDLSVFKQTLGG